MLLTDQSSSPTLPQSVHPGEQNNNSTLNIAAAAAGLTYSAHTYTT